jgi:asparagine N-glycosylation enzyme membrane subunit Stt3
MGEYGNSGVIHTHSTEPHRTDHIFAVSRQIAHLRRFFVPLVLYFALAILMTWPLALYVTRAVPGNAFDSWQNLWNLWWLRRALMHGDNPYVTPMLYYPQGASLLLHTLNPINFLITLPVILTLNLTAAYNAAILASLTLCGLCTYLLALDVTGSRPAALVGGVVFACSGYLLSQVAGGHTHMVAAWPLPLAMLALRRTVHRPSLRNTLLAGLALGLNLLADWQYFLFILIWTGWYSCWIIDALRRRISRSAATVPPPSYPQSGFRRYRCAPPQYPDDRQSRAR